MLRRIVLPERAPTTSEEAATIAAQLDSATTTENPGPAEILRKVVQPNLTLGGLRPQLPCEGLPIPFGLGLRWPNAVRDPIYTQSKKGKPHRQMEMDYLPDSLPEVRVYVLKRRMEGNYKSVFKNISSEIDCPGSDQIQSTLDTIESDAQAKLIDAAQTTLSAVAKSEARDILLDFFFEGTWALIKAIWEYLTTKKITVRLEVPTRIPGFETDEYIVDEFNRTFGVEAKIPVENIRWYAW